MNYPIRYGQHVLDAINLKKPIVGLESTIITHGMPYPQNLETALQCEKIIEEQGCAPATIAIINGEIVIGLSKDEIASLAKATNVVKTSRRDLGYVISQKLNGATTVSATMYLAKLAQIKFFATGGIGGVHRGAETSFDISADLTELGKTDVCVICAGVKAILDLPKTLEYLETQGVLVVGYKTNCLPGFYSATTPCQVPCRIDHPKEIAMVFKTQQLLGLENGLLVVNPVPIEDSIDYQEIQAVIDQALKSMSEESIIGKDVTPYLLSKIAKMTKGNSLATNQKLIYNNCKVAASIAKEYQY